MKLKHLCAIALIAVSAGACARTEAVRMAADTVMLKTNAAPICGSSGAARASSQMAAVETIRAGYDSYVIVGQEAQNNVQFLDGGGTTYLDGTASATGSAYRMGNTVYGSASGSYSGRATYVPGMPMAVGTHDQGLMVKMFKAGDPNGANAIDAREMLGPDWRDKVRSGVNTCLR